MKKIFESERRLDAGDHSVELLAQDFEKNYNMYIYPVHWQFAQLDQHPSDRFVFFCVKYTELELKIQNYRRVRVGFHQCGKYLYSLELLILCSVRLMPQNVHCPKFGVAL